MERLKNREIFWQNKLETLVPNVTRIREVQNITRNLNFKFVATIQMKDVLT